MPIWLEDATPLPAGTDGGSMLGGPPRLVWHTTEGNTAGGAIAAMRQADSWAHLTASYETGAFRCWQHIPLDRAARALRHPEGTVHTNRAGRYCVQVEMVGFATQTPLWPRGYLAGLARLARAVEHACAIPSSSSVRWLAYPASYGPDNGVRLTPAQWLDYAGHLGHEHVPANLHGDPGAFPIDRILAPREGSTDMLMLVRVRGRSEVFALAGGQLVHIDRGWLLTYAKSLGLTEDEARASIVDLEPDQPVWSLPRSG